MQSESTGTPVYPSKTIKVKKCVQVLKVLNNCKMVNKQIIRGFNANELDSIERTLRYNSYLHIKSKADTLIHDEHITFLSLQNSSNLSTNSFIESPQILNPDQSIKDYIEANKENPYINNLASNIVSLTRKINKQKYTSVKRADIFIFIDFIVSGMVNSSDSELKLKIKEEVIKIIRNNDKDKIYSLFRFSLKNEVNHFEYYELMFYYEKHSDDYDVHLKSIDTMINLESNTRFLTIQQEDSSYNILIENSISSSDVDNLMVLNGLMEMMVQVDTIEKQDSPIVFLEDASQAMSTILDGLGTVVNAIPVAWTGLVSLFKNSRSVTVKEKIINKGFKHFDQTAHVQFISGMRPEGLKPFFNLIENRIGVPENRKEDVSMILEEAQWMDSNTWGCFDIAFSIGQGGKVKYASIISNRDAMGKYSFVVTEIHTEFELADDLLVLTKKVSVMGGMFAKSEDKIQRVPKNLTQEDMKSLFMFFQLIVYKQVAAQFGVNLVLPSD